MAYGEACHIVVVVKIAVEEDRTDLEVGKGPGAAVANHIAHLETQMATFADQGTEAGRADDREREIDLVADQGKAVDQVDDLEREND